MGHSPGGRRHLWLGVGPDGVQEEVAWALGVGLGLGVGVEVHDLPVVFWSVEGPGGEVGAVGIAGAGEVGPVLLDLVGEGAVFGAPGGLGAVVEGAEDVLYVVGVEGSSGGGVELVAGGGEVETVAVDGGVAGFNLGFEPGPGGVSDEAVGDEIACGFEGLGAGGVGVKG